MQKEAIIEKFELMKKKGKINEKTLQELGLKPSQSMKESDMKAKSMKNPRSSSQIERTEPQEEPTSKNL